uniref:General transcription factor IIF subunit 2 n=1 Tax=Canis lupus familiaris TaxID=9615 RepID=A0A8C0P701_CANLF
MEPASPSACVSASLSLSLCISHELKKKKKHCAHLCFIPPWVLAAQTQARSHTHSEGPVRPARGGLSRPAPRSARRGAGALPASRRRVSLSGDSLRPGGRASPAAAPPARRSLARSSPRGRCSGRSASPGSSRPMAERGELDLTGAKQNTGVWLVKVPKYLSQQWAKAPGRGEVGKLRIAKNQGRTEVSFTLNEDLANIHDIGGKPASVSTPREHPFVLQSVGGQTLTVFTESSSEAHPVILDCVSESDCSTRCICPMALQIEESSKPVRLSQQLDKVVTTNYKPVANHQYNIEYERKKKEDGKRARADKQHVLDMLFSAFEKHQYYNLKDLVDITKQPVNMLRSSLDSAELLPLTCGWTPPLASISTCSLGCNHTAGEPLQEPGRWTS